MPRAIYTPNVVVDTTNLTEEEWLDYRPPTSSQVECKAPQEAQSLKRRGRR